jgi:putative spermidine/putrescine transport system permease protein
MTRFQPYTSLLEKLWFYGMRIFCAIVLLFLVVPLLVIVPLSFNSGTYLTFPLAGISLRWYEALFASANWKLAFGNSIIVACATTAIATALGTAGAISLKRLPLRVAKILTFLILSPIVVPVVITGVGIYFVYASVGLTNTLPGLVMAHVVLAVPFVVVTVSATLEGFDTGLLRAAASLGAPPLTAFRRVTLPLISPGVMSGALFAFAVSFDDVVVALFLAGPEQRTVPIQMFNGVREEINPIIAAAATLLIGLSLVLLLTVEYLRRRSARYAKVRSTAS